MSKFLIVLLDENFAHKGETWHGVTLPSFLSFLSEMSSLSSFSLKHQASLKNQVTSHCNCHSPWSGPFMCPDTISCHPPQHASRINEDSKNSDDESTSEVNRGLERHPHHSSKAMGLIPQASYYDPPVTILFELMRAAAAHSTPPGPPPPVIPQGSYTPSPHVSALSCVPAWISPAPSHHPSLLVS